MVLRGYTGIAVYPCPGRLFRFILPSFTRTTVARFLYLSSILKLHIAPLSSRAVFLLLKDLLAGMSFYHCRLQ